MKGQVVTDKPPSEQHTEVKGKELGETPAQGGVMNQTVSWDVKGAGPPFLHQCILGDEWVKLEETS